MKQKYKQNTLNSSVIKVVNINLVQISIRSMRNLFLFFMGLLLDTRYDYCKTKLHIVVGYQVWLL